MAYVLLSRIGQERWSHRHIRCIWTRTTTFPCPRLRSSSRLALPPQRRRHQSTATTTTTIVSRRQWNEYLQTARPLRKSAQQPSNNGNNKAAAGDDKPWPRSVRLTGYAVAGTLLPYMLLWIGLTNEETRHWILPYCSPAVEQRLRAHFGETDQPDGSQLSYTDRHDGSGQLRPMPLRLRGERDASDRQQQARIEEHLRQSETVRIRKVHELSSSSSSWSDEDTSVTPEEEHQVLVEMPAATKLTKEALFEQWKKTIVSSSSRDRLAKDPPYSGASPRLLVDFPEPPTRMAEGMDREEIKTTTTTTLPLQTHDDDELTDSSVDPLRIEGRVYSLWHYQPAAPDSSANQGGGTGRQASSNAVMSARDIDVARLRHTIARLQEELNNSTVGTRPIDDIVDELARAKAELRRLQWQKWLPWVY